MNKSIIKHGFKSKADSEIEGSLKLLNLTNSEIDAASADIAVTKDWVNSNFTNKEGTVTSVGMSVPTGLTVNPSSITTSGIFAIEFESGYSIPTTSKQSNWDSAYNHSLVTSGNPHHVAWDELTGSQPAPIAHTHPWSDITSTPTTLAGYGITDAYTKTESDNKYALVGHNHTLDSLSNVAITTKVVDDILKWDGTNWVNVQGTGLSAVDASNISNVIFTLDDGTKITESFGHHHSEYALSSWTNDTYVPYEGASNDLDLGTHNLTVGGITKMRQRVELQDANGTLTWIITVESDGTLNFRDSDYDTILGRLDKNGNLSGAGEVTAYANLN